MNSTVITTIVVIVALLVVAAAIYVNKKVPKAKIAEVTKIINQIVNISGDVEDYLVGLGIVPASVFKDPQVKTILALIKLGVTSATSTVATGVTKENSIEVIANALASVTAACKEENITLTDTQTKLVTSLVTAAVNELITKGV